ncbi:hypothetical protein JX265_002511 [Neoarthrinium moseri]|uniref:Uncharacterized protein n=1 Tax=Neoarthrinium moseri TaxID=1658444 RepID=A0A9P9WV14_9PEZI|nr:uncharacterized protein JN550_000325 [Neoarthrinium moseri]KAI1878143.1 hypothetical protein JN550_000325 [Neoarthrinium moseri]KAI1879557.1 hypothetical protein JX265_002511 [Neoarthrinium moseri]
MMLNPRSYLYSRRQVPSTSPTLATAAPNTGFPSKRRDENITVTPIKNSNADLTSRPTTAMPKRKESSNLSRSPPTTGTTMAAAVARPNTPTSAVQIPVKNKQEASYSHNSRYDAPRRQASSQRRRDRHSPDGLPPSVAALLAITSIPPPSKRAGSRQRMTVDSIVPRSQVSEKELSQELSLSSFNRTPMDVLLSPPDEPMEEDASVTSDSCMASVLSTRAASFDSLPSLGDSLGTTLPSVDSPVTPRSRRFRPPRRSLEPVSSPPGEQAEHPLWVDPDVEVDEMDFSVFDPSAVSTDKQQANVFLPLKTAFKSNLTASLRALRSAARSLSTFTASSVPPEDLLTRSILTMDPRVPFTDERRPPVLDEEPSEAMRRYLNPTDSARLDLRTTPATGPTTRSYTASIQMQTYKVSRSKSAPATSTRKASSPPPSTASTKSPVPPTFPPGPRQREIRENADFIRIAVLEHLMRKRGKFDNSQEGHARWLLPPRKPSAKPYEIGSDGIPIRWIPISQDTS